MVEIREDVVTQGPLDRLAALLDRNPVPGIVPPLGHWLYTLPDAAQAALGPDGHPLQGLVAPPSGLPRRMWAGGRVEFRGAITVGDRIVRRSTAARSVDKGAMRFVTVSHEIRAGEAVVIEEQDLVYLPARTGSDARSLQPVDVPAPEYRRTIVADATMLFRFSALTYNAHRIHYDRDFARDFEHYPGLVVHGPLLAMLLVDDAIRRNPGRQVARFAFRARTAVFDGEAFDLCGAGTTLWIEREGVVAMTAEIGFA